MSDDFSAELTFDDTEAIIRAVGSIDLSSAARLASIGELAFAVDGITSLTVDATDMGFLDSTGIAALVLLRNTGAEAGVPVRLRSPNSQVARVLKVTALYELFVLPESPTD